MIPLVLVHGWGFDAGFWQPVLERLPDFTAEAVDLGFTGRPQLPEVKRPLVVAHSMGLAWALANLPRPWAGAFAINAFPRFTRARHFIEGVAPRVVERMVQRFADEPAAVTAEFLRRCGVDEPDCRNLAPQPLGEALAWLARCDEISALAMLRCPVAAVAGGHDPIVPEAMSRSAFARHDLTIVAEAGHLLPLTNPDWIAGQIRAFAARLA